MPLFLQSALGVFVFIGLAWAVSEDRRAFPWRIVLAGLVFQFVLAAALLKLPWIRGLRAQRGDARARTGH